MDAVTFKNRNIFIGQSWFNLFKVVPHIDILIMQRRFFFFLLQNFDTEFRDQYGNSCDLQWLQGYTSNDYKCYEYSSPTSVMFCDKVVTYCNFDDLQLQFFLYARINGNHGNIYCIKGIRSLFRSFRLRPMCVMTKDER